MTDKQTNRQTFLVLSNIISIPFAVIVFAIIAANIASLFLLGVARGALIGGLVLIFGLSLYCIVKTKIYKNYLFWGIIFVLGVIARLLYGVLSQTPLESDMLLCYNSANSVIRGDLSWLDLPYYRVWSYQIPFVYYEAFILWIFKTVRALYVFDALWGVLICVLIYLIVELLSSNKLIALILASLYAWLPSSILKSGLLYNFSLAGVFLLLGIYCYILALKKINNKPFHICMILNFVSGLLVAISCLFRQEGLVILLACSCFYIFYFITNHNCICGKKAVFAFRCFVSLLLVVIGYIIIVNLASWCFDAAGITSHGLGNNCPYWKIVVGLTPDNYGQYSDRYVWICSIMNPSEQKEAFDNIMKEILSEKSPIEILGFFIKKHYYMWGAIDSGFGIPYNTVLERAFTIVYLALDKFIYLLFLVLSIIGLKPHNDKTYEKHYFYICFIGFFLSYLIFEAGARYRYDPMLILVLTSTFGMMRFEKAQS